MLHDAHFPHQLRAIPAFIAKLIVIQYQLPPIRDADRRNALTIDKVMRRRHQREQET